MSRPDIIKELKRKHSKLNKSQIETIVDTFFQSIEQALKNQKSVSKHQNDVIASILEKNKKKRCFIYFFYS